jgi:hypothetical protein
MRRVGVLMNTTPDEPDSQARVTALAQGLQEAGWAVGFSNDSRNLALRAYSAPTAKDQG